MTVHFLGTGSACTSPDRTTTMLAVEHAGAFFLVDCGADAVQRLLAAGLAPADIEAVVLTHEHADHLAGFPLLVEKLWLLGRRAPIPVYGLAPTLGVAQRLLAVFGMAAWPDMPEIEYHAIEAAEGAAVFERGPFRVTASPVVHPVPTVGLRVEAGGLVVGYSCDTSPCAAAVALGRGADLFVYEATGHLPGVHSSAVEAAEAAAEAGARRLVLVHLPAVLEPLGAARAVFAETDWADEGGRAEVRPADRADALHAHAGRAEAGR